MRYFWELTAVERGLIARQVRLAIIKGEIIPRGCEWHNCNVAKGLGVIAHHEDYDKPLEVTWLCLSHHRLRHAQINKNRPKTWRKISKQIKSEIKSTIKHWPDNYKDQTSRKFMAHFPDICYCRECVLTRKEKRWNSVK